MQNKQLKSEKILSGIGEMIRKKELAPGNKLPAIRQLMDDFNVSQLTIEKSLNKLCKQGELQHVPGQGYFVEDPENQKSMSGAQIDFCFFFRENVMHNPLFGAMTSYLFTKGMEFDCIVNIFAYENMGCPQLFRKKFESSNSRSCIMLGCNNVVFEHILRDLGISAIYLYPNITEISRGLDIDNRAVMSQIIDVLTEAGHKDIAMLHGQGFDSTYMIDQEERIQSFYAEMKARNLPVWPHMVTYGGFTPEEGYTAAKKLFEQNRQQRPTAIIGNDYNAPGIYRAAYEAGIRIPDDLSVFGIDNLDQSKAMSPPLSSVDINWRNTLDIALTMALNSSDSPEGLIRTPVSIINRESVCKVKEKVFC